MNPDTPIERYLTKNSDYFLGLGIGNNGYDRTFLFLGRFIGYDGIKLPMRQAGFINRKLSA